MPETEEQKRKRQALRLATRAADRHADSEQRRRAAMRFAQEQGASLREIAEATGSNAMTVKRILDRAESTAE